MSANNNRCCVVCDRTSPKTIFSCRYKVHEKNIETLKAYFRRDLEYGELCDRCYRLWYKQKRQKNKQLQKLQNIAMQQAAVVDIYEQMKMATMTATSSIPVDSLYPHFVTANRRPMETQMATYVDSSMRNAFHNHYNGQFYNNTSSSNAYNNTNGNSGSSSIAAYSYNNSINNLHLHLASVGYDDDYSSPGQQDVMVRELSLAPLHSAATSAHFPSKLSISSLLGDRQQHNNANLYDENNNDRAFILPPLQQSLPSPRSSSAIPTNTAAAAAATATKLGDGPNNFVPSIASLSPVQPASNEDNKINNNGHFTGIARNTPGSSNGIDDKLTVEAMQQQPAILRWQEAEHDSSRSVIQASSSPGAAKTEVPAAVPSKLSVDVLADKETSSVPPRIQQAATTPTETETTKSLHKPSQPDVMAAEDEGEEEDGEEEAGSADEDNEDRQPEEQTAAQRGPEQYPQQEVEVDDAAAAAAKNAPASAAEVAPTTKVVPTTTTTTTNHQLSAAQERSKKRRRLISDLTTDVDPGIVYLADLIATAKPHRKSRRKPTPLRSVQRADAVDEWTSYSAVAQRHPVFFSRFPPMMSDQWE